MSDGLLGGEVNLYILLHELYNLQHCLFFLRYICHLFIRRFLGLVSSLPFLHQKVKLVSTKWSFIKVVGE